MNGHVAIVTGGTAGIGLETARVFLRDGANVVICSRKQENVDEAFKALSDEFGKEHVLGVVCNVGDNADRVNLIRKTIERFGKLDSLVNNAATVLGEGPLMSVQEDAWDKMMTTNVKSGLILTQLALPHLSKSSNPSIVFISSISAYSLSFPVAAYGLSKTMLLGLTKALAQELGPQGIRVNGVAPGIVMTKFSTPLWKSPISKKLKRQVPLQRFAEPSEIAETILFLCSPKASYVTGQTMMVSGGMSSRL